MMAAAVFAASRACGESCDPAASREAAVRLEPNNPGYLYNLGWLYEQGKGVTKDYGEARKWYEKASAAVQAR